MKNEHRTYIEKNELLTRISPDDLNVIVHNALCSFCQKKTILTNYEDAISVFDNGDALLEGLCKLCGEKVNRVIELSDEKINAFVYTPNIQKATQFAITAHAEQTRKGKDIPYITHPLSVALILARAGADEEVVVAGILHDTVEDSDGKILLDDIEREFGETVAMLVRHVTEEDKSLSWEQRKADALAHIYEMPYGALLLKSADVLHNLSELVADIEEQGDVVWEKFNAPKDKQIAYYQNLVENLEIIWKENPLLPEIKMGAERLL